MRASTAVTVLLSALAASAADITVMVGANSGLTFTPSSITAQVGDNVHFQFMAKNHSVTQSTFANPCQLSQNPVGVDSGFMFIPPGSTSLPVWSIAVQNASVPLWFFCAQTGHCQKGMVFAINAPPTKTFAMFQANAMNAPAANGTAPTTGTTPATGGSSPPAAVSSAAAGGTVPAASVPAASAPAASAPATSAPPASQTGAALRHSTSAAGALMVMTLLVSIAL